jgi:hypothetical protein
VASSPINLEGERAALIGLGKVVTVGHNHTPNAFALSRAHRAHHLGRKGQGDGAQQCHCEQYYSFDIHSFIFY